MRSFFLRIFRIFVIATLCVANALPGPAYALRPAQRESASGAEEIRSYLMAQAGSEGKQIEVYLDPKMEKGVLIGAPSPTWVLRTIRSSFWEESDVLKAKRIVFKNITTEERGRSATFKIRGRDYKTDREPDPALRLMVVVDPKTQLAAEAYDQATGQKVYDLQEQILVYLDPVIESGKLKGSPPIVHLGQKMHAAFWKSGPVLQASQVVLSNVATYKAPASGKAVFSAGSRKYYLDRPFDPHLRLLVVIDAVSRMPTVAYELSTGKELYRALELLEIHLDPEIEEGKLKAGQTPFRTSAVAPRPSFWSLKEVAESEVVVLTNIPPHEKRGVASFSLYASKYTISKDFYKGMRLLVLLDPQTQLPVSAYDSSTGEQVYGSAGAGVVNFYIDPVMESGKLAEGSKVFKSGYGISQQTWESAEVGRAEKVVVTGISTYDNSGKAAFHMRKKGYVTSRRFNPENRLVLLVVTDPKGVPSAAYELASGEQVYPQPPKPKRPKPEPKPRPEPKARRPAPDPKNRIDLYLDPVLEAGRLTPGQEPAASFYSYFPNVGWKDSLIGQSNKIALTNFPVRHYHGIVRFRLAMKTYYIARPFDPEAPLRLLVVADPRTRGVLQAYDMNTGGLVYPESSKVKIYLSPLMEGWRPGKEAVPWKVSGYVPGEVWSAAAVLAAESVVLEGIPTYAREAGGPTAFYVGGKSYSSEVPFDPRNPMRLVVVMNPKTTPPVPVTAHDLETGLLVFSSEEHIQVVLSPRVEEGRLIDPVIYRTSNRLSTQFWEDPKVTAAKTVALDHIPTFPQSGGRLAFSFWGQRHFTSRNLDPQKPLWLLLVVDSSSKPPMVLDAYDSGTGEQVYTSSTLVRIYLDPVVKAGKISNPESFYGAVTTRHFGFWDQKEVKEAKTMALEGVPVSDRNNYATFSVGGKRYSLGRRFDADQPLQLLVVVDPKRVVPLEAYDMATGEKVYTGSDRILVYLNPRVENGRLMEPLEPYRTVDKVSGAFWKITEVQSSSVVGLSNVPVSFKEGNANVRFSVAGKSYPAALQPDPEMEARLLVIVDPPTQRPTAAFDMGTGEQVYPLSDMIQVYLDPRIVAGRLEEGQEPIRQVQRVGSTFWGLSKVKSAARVAFANFRTHRSGEVVEFSLASQSFRTSRRFDDASPPRLLILADRGTRSPIAAYDMETGEQVFPVPQQPGVPADKRLGTLAELADAPDLPQPLAGADPRLGDLADLAEEGDQAGAEEKTRIYLDAVVEDGALVGVPEQHGSFLRIPSVFWEGPELKRAKTLVLSNVPTRKHRYMVEFSVAGESYTVAARAVLPENLRLLVTVDPLLKRPLAAYDMRTGRRLYSSADLIHAYLDPPFENGRLVGAAMPFWRGQKLGQFWSEPKVQQSGSVVLTNVETSHPRGWRNFAFYFDNLYYRTTRPFDPDRPLRLILSVDPRSKKVTAAYDMETGEQVYPAPRQPADERLGALTDLAEEEPTQAGAEEKREIRIYLDPKMSKGRFVGNPAPFRVSKTFPASFWDLPEIREAERVVLTGVPVKRAGKGSRAFQIGGQHYRVSGSTREGLRLRVILDPRQKIPLAAYDEAEGKLLFDGGEMIRVYLDAEVKEGRLAGEPVPLRVVQYLHQGFWDKKEIQEAGKVVLGNVPTHRMNAMTEFAFLGEKHPISRAFNEKKPLRLLLVVDPKDTSSLTAYDQATGEKVYPEARAIKIYLDPAVKNGRLDGNPAPFQSFDQVNASFWKQDKVQKAQQVVFEGVPVFDVEGMAGFSLGSVHYFTTLPFEPGLASTLLVVLDPASGFPLAAYDASGGQVYSSEDQIRIYFDPKHEEGRLAQGAVPIAQRQFVSPALWKQAQSQGVKTVVLSNVPAINLNGKFGFIVKSRSYRTALEFDQGKTVRLIVFVDLLPKPLVRSAYTPGTLEQVYPPSNPPAKEDVRRTYQPIDIYLNPVIENGKLKDGSVLWDRFSAIHYKFWGKPEVQGAKTIVFKNIQAKNLQGKFGFALRGEDYTTTRRFQEGVSLRLLLVSDNKGLPLAAYDQDSGEAVYSSEEVVHVYLDPVIREGKLAGDPIPFRDVRNIRAELWNNPEFSGVQRVVFEGIAGRRYKGDRLTFFLLGRHYYTQYPMKTPEHARLLIEVDSESKQVLAAYDVRTGDPVYSGPKTSSDPRLGALTDLAEEEPAQAGTEEWPIVLRTLQPHSSAVRGIAFSRDGKVLMTAERDGEVRLWNGWTGGFLKAYSEGGLDTSNSAALSPDGKLLALSDGVGFFLYDLQRGGRKPFSPRDGEITALAFSPDGQVLAMGIEYSGSKSHVKLFDIRKDTFLDLIIKEEGERIAALAFTPDGNRLAVGRLLNGVSLVDLDTLERVTEVMVGGDFVSQITFSPEGRRMAVVSLMERHGAFTEGVVTTWDLRDGEEVDGINLTSKIDHSLAFSPDGMMLVTGNEDGEISFRGPSLETLRKILTDDIYLMETKISAARLLAWMGGEEAIGLLTDLLRRDQALPDALVSTVFLSLLFASAHPEHPVPLNTEQWAVFLRRLGSLDAGQFSSFGRVFSEALALKGIELDAAALLPAVQPWLGEEPLLAKMLPKDLISQAVWSFLLGKNLPDPEVARLLSAFTLSQGVSYSELLRAIQLWGGHLELLSHVLGVSGAQGLSLNGKKRSQYLGAFRRWLRTAALVSPALEVLGLTDDMARHFRAQPWPADGPSLLEHAKQMETMVLGKAGELLDVKFDPDRPDPFTDEDIPPWIRQRFLRALIYQGEHRDAVLRRILAAFFKELQRSPADLKTAAQRAEEAAPEDSEVVFARAPEGPGPKEEKIEAVSTREYQIEQIRREWQEARIHLERELMPKSPENLSDALRALLADWSAELSVDREQVRTLRIRVRKLTQEILERTGGPEKSPLLDLVKTIRTHMDHVQSKLFQHIAEQEAQTIRLWATQDPVEKLHLGWPQLGGSCLDCMVGTMRKYAQAYASHPGSVVLFAGKASPPEAPPLARLALVLAQGTGQASALLAVSSIYTSQPMNFLPSFIRYLEAYAAAASTPVFLPLELFVNNPGPGWENILVEVKIPAGPNAEFYSDLTGSGILPYTRLIHVWAFFPKRPEVLPAQAGAEEAAARAVESWQSEEGTAAVVLSSSLLNQPYAADLKAALRNLPPELAERVYLAGNWAGMKEANRHLKVISNGSPDDVSIAVGQQTPAPEKVWLVGEFAPVYGWMLRQMGMEPEEIASGADIQEFLAQLGILLSVPEAQVQSGVEELHRAEEAVEGQV